MAAAILIQLSEESLLARYFKNFVVNDLPSQLTAEAVSRSANLLITDANYQTTKLSKIGVLSTTAELRKALRKSVAVDGSGKIVVGAIAVNRSS